MPDSHVLLAEAELATLMSTAREITLEAGDVVFRRGDAGTHVYAVLEGAVELRFGEGKAPKQIGSRALFGELAVLMEDTVRSADAVASAPTRIAAWGASEIDGITETDPRVVLDIIVRSCRYLLASEEALIGDLQRRNEALDPGHWANGGTK